MRPTLPAAIAVIFGLFSILAGCSSGQVVWDRTAPCDVGAVAAALAKNGPTLAVLGTGIDVASGRSAWVVQAFDEDGNLKWRRECAEGEENVAGDIALNRRGDVFVAGRSRIDGREMCLIVRYRMDGTMQWQRALSVGDESRANGICLVDDGLALCGLARKGEDSELLLALLDQAGETKWTRNLRPGVVNEGVRIATDGKGNLIVAGNTGTAENTDIILLKVGADGDTIWTRTYDSGAEDVCGDVTVDVFGNVLATGTATDGESPRCVLLEYHPDGELIRHSAYGERTPAEGRGITTTTEGDIFVAGVLHAPTGSAQPRQTLAFQYKPNATSVWERNWHPGGAPTGGVDVAADKDVYVLCTAESGTGGSEMVLVRMSRPEVTK